MHFKIKISFFVFYSVLLFLISFSCKSEKDALHKRNYTIMFTEIKDNVAKNKTIMDKLKFKNCKLYSTYLSKKFNYKWLSYRINIDSVFIDSTDTEVRLLEIESTKTDDANITVKLNFTILEWQIDGTVKIIGSNDKIKKYFDLTGFEKGGKAKKEKKVKLKRLPQVQTY